MSFQSGTDARDLVTVCHIATRSPDPSTQNGAAIRLSDGSLIAYACNEFPIGVAYSEERWQRPLKYELIEHAERNAIYLAAKVGVRTEGLTLVAAWAACSDCARAIIQAGLSKLVTIAPVKGDTNERWDASISVAMTMLDEAGVEVVYIDPAELEDPPALRRDGKLRLPTGELVGERIN